jgi:DNA-binding NtrC family response regulator
LEEEDFDVVITELKIPSTDGIELLKRIKGGPSAATDVVLMSANGSIPAAVAAVKLGAFDFICKPLRGDDIRPLIAKIEQERQKENHHPVDDAARIKAAITREVIGDSQAMQRVKRMIKISARTDANVLLYGETGVGKDLVASVIHRNSHRRKSPYVQVGCTLFPSTLIENELYGHEEGSYTGADQSRPGRFELAEKGTIYLDDVDDIPVEHQAKLLRAIEEKVYERVGGTRPIKADVRIVASTKRNLLEKIADGTFRQDLYYRLDVLRIQIPPLRDRRQDIPALARHLLDRIAKHEPCEIAPDAVALLTQFDWPGNVRELYHTLERAYLVGGGRITPELLATEMGGPPDGAGESNHAGGPVAGGFRAMMEHAEKQLLISALEATGGNKTAAANTLGMKPSTFRDKLTKYEIK